MLQGTNHPPRPLNRRAARSLRFYARDGVTPTHKIVIPNEVRDPQFAASKRQS